MALNFGTQNQAGAGFGGTGLINVTNVAALTNMAQFTVSAWVLRGAVSGSDPNMVVCKGFNFGNSPFAINMTQWAVYSIELDASLWNTSSGVYTCPAPAFGVWAHIAVSYDYGSAANVPSIYVDGVAQTITTQSVAAGLVATDTQNVVIGNSAGGHHGWTGSVADVAIWDTILSANEVAAMARGVRPGVIRYSNLQLWFPLDGWPTTEWDWSKNNLVTNSQVGTTQTNNPPILQFKPMKVLSPVTLQIPTAHTVTNTLDVALASMKTKNDTFDAILTKKNTPTSTFDAPLASKITKTSTFDADLVTPVVQTTTATFDALIALLPSRLSSSFDAFITSFETAIGKNYIRVPGRRRDYDTTNIRIL